MATKKAAAATLPPKKRARVQTIVLDGIEVIKAITGITTMLGRVDEALKRNEADAFGDPFSRAGKDTSQPFASYQPDSAAYDVGTGPKFNEHEAKQRLMTSIHDAPTAYAANEKAIRDMGLHEMLGDLLELSMQVSSQTENVRNGVCGHGNINGCAEGVNPGQESLGVAKDVVCSIRSNLYAIHHNIEDIGLYVLNTSMSAPSPSKR